jgi:hypothetical protein
MENENKIFAALREKCAEYVRCDDVRRLEILDEIKPLLFKTKMEDGYYGLVSRLDNQRHAYQDSVLVGK